MMGSAGEEGMEDEPTRHKACTFQQRDALAMTVTSWLLQYMSVGSLNAPVRTKQKEYTKSALIFVNDVNTSPTKASLSEGKSAYTRDKNGEQGRGE